MSNKNKNIINVAEERKFLSNAYGLDTREINEYQLRITHEEFNGFFDWYHTTGTVIKNHNGKHERIAKRPTNGDDLGTAVMYQIDKANGLPPYPRRELGILHHSMSVKEVKEKIKDHPDHAVFCVVDYGGLPQVEIKYKK